MSRKNITKNQTMLKASNILISLLFVISTNLFSQELKYSELSSGVKPKGDFTSYVAKDGAVYNIGDKITLGVPSSNKTFAYITEGDGIFLPITLLYASASGQNAAIKRIDIGGSKRTGYFVSMRCKGLTGLSNYSIQLENAIETGEVKSFGMTSDEALAELKKAKEKLDLDIITQVKYDSLKAEYTKFIK
jgi:hypothetical protein